MFPEGSFCLDATMRVGRAAPFIQLSRTARSRIGPLSNALGGVNPRVQAASIGLVRSPQRGDWIMFTKTTKALVAALVLTGASITFVADASAAQSRGPSQGVSQAEQNWMDRATYGGHLLNADGF
jgi:hypothetical protein